MEGSIEAEPPARPAPHTPPTAPRTNDAFRPTFTFQMSSGSSSGSSPENDNNDNNEEDEDKDEDEDEDAGLRSATEALRAATLDSPTAKVTSINSQQQRRQQQPAAAAAEQLWSTQQLRTTKIETPSGKLTCYEIQDSSSSE